MEVKLRNPLMQCNYDPNKGLRNSTSGTNGAIPARMTAGQNQIYQSPFSNENSITNFNTNSLHERPYYIYTPRRINLPTGPMPKPVLRTNENKPPSTANSIVVNGKSRVIVPQINTPLTNLNVNKSVVDEVTNQKCKKRELSLGGNAPLTTLNTNVLNNMTNQNLKKHRGPPLEKIPLTIVNTNPPQINPPFATPSINTNNQTSQQPSVRTYVPQIDSYVEINAPTYGNLTQKVHNGNMEYTHLPWMNNQPPAADLNTNTRTKLHIYVDLTDEPDSPILQSVDENSNPPPIQDQGNQGGWLMGKFDSKKKILTTPTQDEGSQAGSTKDITFEVYHNSLGLRCHLCNIRFEDGCSFNNHLAQFHQAHPASDPNTLPNPQDPKHYCRVCGFSYSKNRAYRRHLERDHNMFVLFQAIPPEALPDPNDPNYYCSACKRKYSGKKNFWSHLRNTHLMKIDNPNLQAPIYDPNVEIDVNDPKNTWCIHCKTKYSDGDHYRRHMKKYHKDGRTKPVHRFAQVNPNIIPDINDPNGYCKSCDITFKSRPKYIYHLNNLHGYQLYQV